uniref:Uncharacterized protein LOC102804699 n=1 Tax=Saccoglossus kowalevskii TaxID=10224 RepID=A0ABM0M5J8_SACKO|nr:PREDICTED: uncharacterized protein LOC102804699 [Saccoglossus kowalevskii]
MESTSSEDVQGKCPNVACRYDARSSEKSSSAEDLQGKIPNVACRYDARSSESFTIKQRLELLCQSESLNLNFSESESSDNSEAFSEGATPTIATKIFMPMDGLPVLSPGEKVPFRVTLKSNTSNIEEYLQQVVNEDEILGEDSLNASSQLLQDSIIVVDDETEERKDVLTSTSGSCNLHEKNSQENISLNHSNVSSFPFLGMEECWESDPIPETNAVDKTGMLSPAIRGCHRLLKRRQLLHNESKMPSQSPPHNDLLTYSSTSSCASSNHRECCHSFTPLNKNNIDGIQEKSQTCVQESAMQNKQHLVGSMEPGFVEETMMEITENGNEPILVIQDTDKPDYSVKNVDSSQVTDDWESTKPESLVEGDTVNMMDIESRSTTIDNHITDTLLISNKMSNHISTKQKSTENNLLHNTKEYKIVPNKKLSDIENEKTLFDSLPVEIMMKILSYLTPKELLLYVAPISKKWYSLAHEPILWQHLSISTLETIDSYDLCQIIRGAPLLKSLSLRARDELNITEIRMLTIYCNYLQNINLGFCDNVNEKIIETLGQNCKNLECVNVEGCERISDRCIKYFTALPKLRTLNLSHCIKITDKGVILLAEQCERLQELNIDGIPWITDDAVKILATNRRDILKAVYLDGAEMTDKSLKYVSDCKHLRVLSVSFAEQLTDVSLKYVKKLTNLHHLRLKRGVEYSDYALVDTFSCANLHQLTYLNLTECSELSDKALQYIALGEMETLDLLGLDKILGMCLVHIPKCMPRLAFLDLRQCNRISDFMLTDLVIKKPNLVIINYYGDEVSPQSM